MFWWKNYPPDIKIPLLPYSSVLNWSHVANYLELFWQADLGYIEQAIFGVEVPNNSHMASIQHWRVHTVNYRIYFFCENVMLICNARHAFWNLLWWTLFYWCRSLKGTFYAAHTILVSIQKGSRIKNTWLTWHNFLKRNKYVLYCQLKDILKCTKAFFKRPIQARFFLHRFLNDMPKPISRGVENFYIWLSEEFICSQPFKSYTYSKSWDTYILELIFKCWLSWQGYLHSSLIQSISCLHNPWHCSIKHCTSSVHVKKSSHFYFYVVARPLVVLTYQHSTREGYEYALATQTLTYLLPSVCGNHYCKKQL